MLLDDQWHQVNGKALEPCLYLKYCFPTTQKQHVYVVMIFMNEAKRKSHYEYVNNYALFIIHIY